MKKSNEEKRVIIYCRESRDDYGENYERIETQRDLLVKYCKSHGYTNIVFSMLLMVRLFKIRLNILFFIQPDHL